jgi:S1-C subfamily serine protease
MGARIADAGGDELSAYGVSLGDKGVAFEDVPSESLAGRLGFRKGDLIRSVNQRKIESVSDLRKYLLESGKKAAHSFELIRNQATIRINLTTTLDPMN